MQEKLSEILKTLGLPIALAAVIVAVANLLGLPLEQAFGLFPLLLGVPFVISLLIDLLKGLKIVTPGTSAQWSAALNLVSIIGLAVLLKFIPDFYVTTWDAQLMELAKAVMLIVTWLLQLFGTKSAHGFYTRGLGIRKFSFA